MKLDWEKDAVEALDGEELADALADPEIGDAADWIFKLSMQVVAAVRMERTVDGCELSPVAEALAVGCVTERKVAHAFQHLADVALRHTPGHVPYIGRVRMMRRALKSVHVELSGYWRAPSGYAAAKAVISFIHSIFQSRYVLAPEKWREQVMEQKDAAVRALASLASDYAQHFDEERTPRPASAPAGGKGVSRFAGQSINGTVKVGRDSPQTFTVEGVKYVISGQKAIDIVDRLLAAYEDHEGEYVPLPPKWRTQFKRRGAPAFCQYIEPEYRNHRATGRARLHIPRD